MVLEKLTWCVCVCVCLCVCSTSVIQHTLIPAALLTSLHWYLLHYWPACSSSCNYFFLKDLIGSPSGICCPRSSEFEKLAPKIINMSISNISTIIFLSLVIVDFSVCTYPCGICTCVFKIMDCSGIQTPEFPIQREFTKKYVEKIFLTHTYQMDLEGMDFSEWTVLREIDLTGMCIL